MKKVAIVGYTPTKDLAPFKDESWEIWGLNDLYKTIPRYDRWFEFHGKHREGYIDKTLPNRTPWLEIKEFFKKMQCPVYLQEAIPEVPTSVKYPIKEILAEFGQYFVEPKDAKYFTNSISYMIALAIYEKYDEIHVYGVDMATSGEYHHQRPSCEFWLGVAVGRGIKTHIPDQSDLLKTRFLYGYEDEKKHVFEKKIEQLKLDVAQRKQTAEQQMTQLNAQKWQFVGAETALKEVMMAWQ